VLTIRRSNLFRGQGIANIAVLHPVALENPAARRRQSAAILLQALLHSHIIAEILSAKMRSIPRASALLLGRAGVLCQSN
jgi:hypothetical protein